MENDKFQELVIKQFGEVKTQFEKISERLDRLEELELVARQPDKSQDEVQSLNGKRKKKITQVALRTDHEKRVILLARLARSGYFR